MINNRGIIKTKKPGVATITVTANSEVFDTCYITVVKITNYDSTDGLLRNQISALAVDSNGNLWCATRNGASKFDGTKWKSFTQVDGLIDNRINTIEVDPKNNLWFGTESGVSKFNNVNWKSYTIDDGLCNNTVRNITFDNRGNTWFGTSGGLSIFNDTSWFTYTLRNGLLGTHENIVGIQIDNLSGDAWVATYDAVSIYKNNTWSGYYGSSLPTGSTTIYNIALDNYNNKWLCTIDGFFELLGGNWVEQMNDTNFYLSYAHDILFCKNKNIWFTTRDGIFKYNGRYISSFVGLNKTLINKTEIVDIALDREENIWIAKTFEGIFKLETK
jgi:ligand-binding sensor domain-containing protein